MYFYNVLTIWAFCWKFDMMEDQSYVVEQDGGVMLSRHGDENVEVDSDVEGI